MKCGIGDAIAIDCCGLGCGSRRRHHGADTLQEQSACGEGRVQLVSRWREARLNHRMSVYTEMSRGSVRGALP